MSTDQFRLEVFLFLKNTFRRCIVDPVYMSFRHIRWYSVRNGRRSDE